MVNDTDLFRIFLDEIDKSHYYHDLVSRDDFRISKGKIISLSLDSLNIQNLPHSITNLRSLQSLRLRKNNFSAIPDEIGLLSDLQLLDLRDNNLTSLPFGLLFLTELETLGMSNNTVTFNNSTDIINDFSKIEKFLLKTFKKNIHSKLTKVIIKNFQILETHNSKDLVKLYYLMEDMGLENVFFEVLHNIKIRTSLKNNTSQIEQELFIKKRTLIRETRLIQLNLSNCSISKISSKIYEFSKLEKLDLSHNQITKLPPYLYYLENLRSINLDQNLIEHFPNELYQNMKLKQINLSHNKIKELPAEVFQYPGMLTELVLKYNEISEIHLPISRTNKLSKLYLIGNKLPTALQIDLESVSAIKEFIRSLNIGKQSREETLDYQGPCERQNLFDRIENLRPNTDVDISTKINDYLSSSEIKKRITNLKIKQREFYNKLNKIQNIERGIELFQTYKYNLVLGNFNFAVDAILDAIEYAPNDNEYWDELNKLYF